MSAQRIWVTLQQGWGYISENINTCEPADMVLDIPVLDEGQARDVWTTLVAAYEGSDDWRIKEVNLLGGDPPYFRTFIHMLPEPNPRRAYKYMTIYIHRQGEVLYVDE